MKEIRITGEFQVSDGYHTIDELYEHRIALWIALCRRLSDEGDGIVWKSRIHSDGTSFDGWFVLGFRRGPGKQITYHLPEREWMNTPFAAEMERAPQFDGHTSQDVLDRLRQL